MFSERQGFGSIENFGDDFVIRINTNNTGSSGNTQFTLPAVGSYTIDWGDGNIQSLSGTQTHTYSTAGIYTIKISGALQQISFNSSGDRFKLIQIANWGNIAWTSQVNAFAGCWNLTGRFTDSPNLSGVGNCYGMFNNCRTFNSYVNDWDVSTVTNMATMFISALSFNQPLGDWNVANVTNMSFMLYNTNYNYPLDTWDVGNVTNMSNMFEGVEFNQPLNTWNVSNVTNMSSMFRTTSIFNQDLSNWNVNNVSNMNNMFNIATAFNQDLGAWTLRTAGVTMGSMLDNCGMNTENYSRTLIGWANHVYANGGPNSTTLGASGRTYSSSTYGTGVFTDAVAARAYLVNTATWVITGDTAV